MRTAEEIAALVRIARAHGRVVDCFAGDAPQLPKFLLSREEIIAYMPIIARDICVSRLRVFHPAYFELIQ